MLQTSCHLPLNEKLSNQLPLNFFAPNQLPLGIFGPKPVTIIPLRSPRLVEKVDRPGTLDTALNHEHWKFMNTGNL